MVHFATNCVSKASRMCANGMSSSLFEHVKFVPVFAKFHFGLHAQSIRLDYFTYLLLSVRIDVEEY